MKLRHVILLASAVGACGALLLAADMFRRLKEAENALVLRSTAAGKDAPLALLASQPPGDESVLTFLSVHTFGLLSLAFLFLAVFLLIVAALRDRSFAAAVDRAAPPDTSPALAATQDLKADAVVLPLSDMARQALPAPCGEPPTVTRPSGSSGDSEDGATPPSVTRPSGSSGDPEDRVTPPEAPQP